MSDTRAEDMATIDTLLTEETDTANPDEGEKLIPTVDELLEEEKEKDKEEEEERDAAAVGGQVEAKGLVGDVESVAKKEAQFVASLGYAVGDFLQKARTPGGLFLPISLLVLFFFVLIPINGYSRIVWLWLVITGNAQLAGDAQAVATREQDIITLQEQTLGQLNITGAGASFPSTLTGSNPQQGELPTNPPAPTQHNPATSAQPPGSVGQRSTPSSGGGPMNYTGYFGPYSIGGDEL